MKIIYVIACITIYINNEMPNLVERTLDIPPFFAREMRNILYTLFLTLCKCFPFFFSSNKPGTFVDVHILGGWYILVVLQLNYIIIGY